MGKFMDPWRRRIFGAEPGFRAGLPMWFDEYPVTSEDEAFMWRMYGRTLLPTSVRLPSGRTTTGDELRQWFSSHVELRDAQ